MNTLTKATEAALTTALELLASQQTERPYDAADEALWWAEEEFGLTDEESGVVLAALQQWADNEAANA